MAMKPGMKMLMAAKTGQGGRTETAMRGRDSRGRYMDGDMRMGSTEMRRRRDDRGRYMERDEDDGPRMAYDGNPAMRPWPEPHIPPYLDRPGMERGRMHKDEGENPYGEEPEVYRQQHPREASYGGNIKYRRADGGSGNISYFKATDPHKGPQMMGFQQQDQHQEHKNFDKQTAMEWVENMVDSSGIKGGAYTWHQAQQYGRNLGITGEERLIEFYAAMNAMHADYCQVARKYGVDKPEFYAHMAKAFIEDPDAVDDKVQRYFEEIARK